MMISSPVIPIMTSIFLKPMDDIFRLPDDNIVVISDVVGNLSGTMIISFKADEGMRIINKMLGRDVNMIKDLEEEEIGALKEYLNIIGGSYLSKFGNTINLDIRAEVPNFEGKFSEVKSIIEEQLKALNRRILFVNSSMAVVEMKVDATFYIIFDEDSLNMVLNLISNGQDDPFEQEL